VDKGGAQAGKARVSFREAFRGYNKDDVNAYLEETNLRFATVEEDYRRTIKNQKQTIEGLEFRLETFDQINGELANLKRQLADKDEQIEESAKKLAEYERQIADLREQLGKLTSECGELGDKLSAAVAENSILIDENADLTKETQALRARLDECEKSAREQAEQLAVLQDENQASGDAEHEKRLYDEMSRKLGDVMIIAKESADKLIENAKAEAGRIKAEAMAEADRVREEAAAEVKAMREGARSKLETAFENANKKLFSMSEDYIRGYAEYLRGVQGEFDAMISALRAKSGEIKGKVDNMRAVISEELEREFDRINRDMHADTDTVTRPENEIIYGTDISDEEV
jgi:DivIVA domain-containing protein